MPAMAPSSCTNTIIYRESAMKVNLGKKILCARESKLCQQVTGPDAQPPELCPCPIHIHVSVVSIFKTFCVGFTC